VIDIDDNPDHANGFVISTANPLALQQGIIKAIRFYDDENRWKNMQRNAMQSDYSWTESASKYLSLYRELLTTKVRQMP